MTAPLRISTDNAAEIAQLRSQIAALKASMMSAPPPGYKGAKLHSQNPLDNLLIRSMHPPRPGFNPVTGTIDTDVAQQQLEELQRRLDALLDPNLDVGPNLSAAPPQAPVFSGPRLDYGRVGVDALKLITYPGVS